MCPHCGRGVSAAACAARRDDGAQRIWRGLREQATSCDWPEPRSPGTRHRPGPRRFGPGQARRRHRRDHRHHHEARRERPGRSRARHRDRRASTSRSAAPQSLLDATGLAHRTSSSASRRRAPASAPSTPAARAMPTSRRRRRPAFGVMVDGMLVRHEHGPAHRPLRRTAQIEINRGPQGLLYGKNTTAGVIDIKRTRPTEEMGVRAQFSYGSFDEWTAKADAQLRPPASTTWSRVKLGVSVPRGRRLLRQPLRRQHPRRHRVSSWPRSGHP